MIQTEQKKWNSENGWVNLDGKLTEEPQLVLVFGERELIKSEDHFKEIKKFYKNADIILGSTAGEIIESEVSDNSLVVTAIYFEKTKLHIVESAVDGLTSKGVGDKVGKKLDLTNLKHVLLFSDGNVVNGTDLVESFSAALPKNISVTGGLVGDGDRFEETVLGLNKPGQSEQIVAIGLYGDDIEIGYGSLGGWDPFGPKRVITKSKDNILYELDNKPALDLYKEYLGEKAKELPSSGLLFPLSLDLDGTEVVRTLLAINEDDKSLTFAGNMPEKVHAQFMKANFDRLIEGAETAANMTTQIMNKDTAEFALLISCVGRKLVLGARIEEEVESVRDTIGMSVPVTGFYSYGEISPTSPTEKQCQLQNQTMTITTFREK